MCLNSALDLWPPDHFAAEFFASQFGRSEMECSNTAQINMFGAIHQHLKQNLIQNFSTHFLREGTITIIVLLCTELHFLSNNRPPFSQHEQHVYLR